MAREPQGSLASFLAFQSTAWPQAGPAQKYLSAASVASLLVGGEAIAEIVAAVAAAGCVCIRTAEESVVWVATFGWKLGRRSLAGAWEPSTLKASLLALSAASLEWGPYLSCSRIVAGSFGTGWAPSMALERS